MPSLHSVIMAGGSGTRFWPASRKKRPKQFLPLAGGQTLIRATVERAAAVSGIERVWIVTNPEQAVGMRELVPEVAAEHIIVEPEARDTAPCVALATATIAAGDPNATMVVMPADHIVASTAEFARMVRRGADLAADNETLVTFGIAPTYPATGFGYVECGERWDDGAPEAHRVARFREKPDAETARKFVAAGTFLWNSGIFVWTAKAVLAAMRTTDPALADATQQMTAAVRTKSTDRLVAAFRAAPRTSIDYALMEKAPKIAVIRATTGWNDVGGFAALPTVGAPDDADNHSLLVAGATQIALESRGNLVYAEGRQTVCLFGVDNLVVVTVGDAVLVCQKHRTEEIKKFVDHVRSLGRTDLL